jgi:hypothetical protein
VISFFNEGKSIYRVCLFCIFVTNKIYLLEVEMLELVLLAGYLNFRYNQFRGSPIFLGRIIIVSLMKGKKLHDNL